MSKNQSHNAAQTSAGKSTEGKESGNDVAVIEKPSQADPQGGNAVSERSRGEVITGSMMDKMSGMAGKGLENVTAKDVLIPRISILQSISYQMKPTRPEFIKDAKVGQFCDVALGEVWDGPIIYLPVFYVVNYLEWLPGRKGLAGVHASPDILAEAKPNDRRQPVLPNGNTIQETAQFYGLNLNANARESFIPMASTQLKKAKKWNSLAKNQQAFTGAGVAYEPPLFFRTYLLTSVPEQNDQGDWMGFKIEAGPKLEEMNVEDGERLFSKAVKLYDSIIAGLSKADLESMKNDDETGNSSRM